MERGGSVVLRGKFNQAKHPESRAFRIWARVFREKQSNQSRGAAMTLEFGILAPFNLREGHTEHEAFREWLDLACIADDLGVDCFWLAEFHFRPHTPISAPLVVGSAL